jgi:hypothetical protein
MNLEEGEVPLAFHIGLLYPAVVLLVHCGNQFSVPQVGHHCHWSKNKNWYHHQYIAAASSAMMSSWLQEVHLFWFWVAAC